MSGELIQDDNFPDMTMKEAQAATTEIQQAQGEQALRVYLIWKRNGFKKMGYSGDKGFSNFCEEVLSLHPQTAYDWIVRVEQSILTGRVSLSQVYDGHTLEKGQLLPTKIAKELRKLPTQQTQIQAWEEFRGLHEANGTDPHSLHMKSLGLQRIVKRILGETNLPAPPPPDTDFDNQAAAPPESAPTPAHDSEADYQEMEAKRKEFEDAHPEIYQKETLDVAPGDADKQSDEEDPFAEEEEDFPATEKEALEIAATGSVDRLIGDADEADWSGPAKALVIRGCSESGKPFSIFVHADLLKQIPELLEYLNAE